jgi:hypothetical protein
MPDPTNMPTGVVLFYMDGSEAPIDSLMYMGEEEEHDGMMHVWEALDPLPEKQLSRMKVDHMPSRTRVVVTR